MEILTETKCPYKIKPGVKMKMQKIDNCSNALKFVEDCGIKVYHALTGHSSIITIHIAHIPLQSCTTPLNTRCKSRRVQRT